MLRFAHPVFLSPTIISIFCRQSWQRADPTERLIKSLVAVNLAWGFLTLFFWEKQKSSTPVLFAACDQQVAVTCIIISVLRHSLPLVRLGFQSSFNLGQDWRFWYPVSLGDVTFYKEILTDLTGYATFPYLILVFLCSKLSDGVLP